MGGWLVPRLKPTPGIGGSPWFPGSRARATLRCMAVRLQLAAPAGEPSASGRLLEERAGWRSSRWLASKWRASKWLGILALTLLLAGAPACEDGGPEPPAGLELIGLGETPAERVLASALEARFAGEPWTLRFQLAPEEGIAPPTESPAGLPAEFARWGERPGQWFVGRVSYRHPADLLRVTRLEGARWTVDLVLSDAELLARAPERCAPAPQPGIDALRRGELELSWSWRDDGAGELRCDRRAQLEVMPAGAGELQMRDSLRWRLPEDGSAHAVFAKSVSELTRGRWQARSMAGLTGDELQVWHARPSWSFDHWVARTGGVAPRFEPSTRGVFLAVEGHRDADLRALGAHGEWLDAFGAASDARLEQAVVAASSATWLGAALDPWVARLQRAGLSLSLDELFSEWLPGAAPQSATATGAGSPSALISEPQLAFAARWLAFNHAEEPAEFLIALWSGEVRLELPDAALEARYQAALTALAETEFEEQLRVDDLPWGVCLRLPPDPAKWIGTPTLESLTDARRAGARHVQVEVVAWESKRGYSQRPTVRELQWLADRCSEAQLGLCLATHLLDAPGRHLLGVEFTGDREAFAADLDRLDSAAVHFALLAERVRADWLCLTSDTHVWLRTRESDLPADAIPLDEFGRERLAQAAERWPGLIARLRGCTGARLTVAVSSPSSLAQFGHWETLDAASITLFPAHLASPEGYLRASDLEVKLGLYLETCAAAYPSAVPLILWGAGATASELGRQRADLRGGDLDSAVPELFTSALREVLGPEPASGLLLWDWPIGPDDQPRGLGLRGRLDADVLTR